MRAVYAAYSPSLATDTTASSPPEATTTPLNQQDGNATHFIHAAAFGQPLHTTLIFNLCSHRSKATQTLKIGLTHTAGWTQSPAQRLLLARRHGIPYQRTPYLIWSAPSLEATLTLTTEETRNTGWTLLPAQFLLLV